jgi:glycosyltransferase involved in cell wall biosynthesis
VKIAMLSHMHHPIAEPFEGGTEAHTAMVADALVARGHDVTLFAKAGSVTSATIYPLVPKDFEFVRAATPLVRRQQAGFLAEAVHHSIGIIRQGDFDVVLNNSLSSLPYTFLRDEPMLTILHTPPTLSDVTAIITAPGWRPSDLHSYLTVSETNAANWRVSLPSVGVVHNGIRLEDWNSGAEADPDLAVWAARITPEKGLHLAIDAARLAGLRFEFAGPVSNTDYFADEIEPRLGTDVVYRGHLAHRELHDFFASGAVFVASPLWSEPFGLSVVEALASGTPVAGLPNGALPEIVDRMAGSIAVDGSVEALAAAIATARDLDRSGARRASGRFAFDTMVDAYEVELERLAALVDRDSAEWSLRQAEVG